jgi:septal ring factor EnvC (AmiA/AmiB activator)
MQHEWRMKQLAKDIEQIEKETERLRQQNARPRQQRSREKAWRTSVEEFFSQPESNLTPQQAATEPGSNLSSP